MTIKLGNDEPNGGAWASERDIGIGNIRTAKVPIEDLANPKMKWRARGMFPYATSLLAAFSVANDNAKNLQIIGGSDG